MIVDDDRATRLLMRHKLERDGYVVEEAADGRAAITEFERTSPDIVLMDASMPEMNGFTACSEIRKRPDAACTCPYCQVALGETLGNVHKIE